MIILLSFCFLTDFRYLKSSADQFSNLILIRNLKLFRVADCSDLCCLIHVFIQKKKECILFLNLKEVILKHLFFC